MIGVDWGHSNRNMSETTEYFRKPVVPSCSAIVKLSVGMRYVNKGSKWRKIYAIEHKDFSIGAASLHINKRNKILGLLLKRVLLHLSYSLIVTMCTY